MSADPSTPTPFPAIQDEQQPEQPIQSSTGPQSKSSTQKTDPSKSIVSRRRGRKKRTLGILADKETDEVPGTVLLLSKFSTRNIPLGLQHESARGRSSTRGSISGEADRRRSLSGSAVQQEKKKTADGQVILDPQPDDSKNDPLNWPTWRRDAALLSLGFYCMVGGGMTPILAAGFHQVSQSLNVSYADVARTTGLYMLGLGIGSVIFSPTAILYGKRPVYLLSSILFIVASVWCALAPNYTNLVIARIFQGIAVSPVECLPSATIAEIFFLHERAFRVGIYGLLLLGGKNLVPLVSAVVIQELGWRWVFWVVAIIVGFGGVMLFLFVPETFWDRTPRPRALTRRSSSHIRRRSASRTFRPANTHLTRKESHSPSTSRSQSIPAIVQDQDDLPSGSPDTLKHTGFDGSKGAAPLRLNLSDIPRTPAPALVTTPHSVRFANEDATIPTLHNLNSPYYVELEKSDNYVGFHNKDVDASLSRVPTHQVESDDPEKQQQPTAGDQPQTVDDDPTPHPLVSYTTWLKQEPAKPWSKMLKPWNGRLNKTTWWRAAVRPAILYAYPAVLWSALVYSLSIGWLIVLSESVSAIYANRQSYNFTSLQIGLVYMSPFIGGILGTAVAGKLSDVVVRFMARRNDGIYEPEYRLVMAVPITISTVMGLMGFGWSAEERDAWIVPTIFFGVISFGCSLGSTTSITFCVDSYRQYAGEALVTLNFSKNVFHGLVWSLFFPHWLESDGSKKVFITIGGIQIVCMLFTIPMYLYGKRARMWTVRKRMMDRF